jgi:hypothetical protein
LFAVKSGYLVTAFVGRTWMVVLAVGLLMAFGIWGVGFAVYQQVLTGAAYAMAVVVVGIASTGLLLGFRGRISITSGGVVLTAPFRSRTISWDDIADVDMVFGRTWVRCRDHEGRITILVATSAWHPRTNGGVRRDNEALATSLWTGSRSG